MASFGLLGLLVPRNPVRDIRATFPTVCARQGGGAGGYPTNGGREIVRCRGITRRLPDRDLQRSKPGSCCSSAVCRSRDIIGVRSVAGVGTFAETPLCGEPVKTIKALEEGVTKNGEYSVICFFDPERGPSSLVRHKKGVSPLQVAPIYVGLVHFPMGRTVLQMHCTPFRMGAFPSMVYTAGGSIRQGTPKIRISDFSVPRRFPNRPNMSRSSVQNLALHQGKEGHRKADETTGAHAAADQGGVDRIYPGGASRGNDRHDENALLHCASQGGKGAGSREATPHFCPVGEALGKGQDSATFLRTMRLSDAGYAMGQVLHPCPVLGHVSSEIERFSGALPVEPPERSRSSNMATPFGSGISWKTDGPRAAGGLYSYRCFGHGVRRHPQLPKHESWSGGAVVGTRRVELEGPRSEHHVSGAKGATHGVNRRTRTTVNQACETQLAFAHRQPGRSAYHKFLCVCQPTNDARAATAQVGAGQIGISNQIRVDSFSCQSVRGQAVTTLLPRRLADPQPGAAFRAGWNESTHRFIPFPTPRRAPTLPPTGHVQGTRGTLGPHGSPSIVPTSGPDRGSSPEVARNPGTGDVAHPQLASTAKVLGSAWVGEEGRGAGSSSQRGMGGTPQHQPPLATDATGGESRVETRTQRRLGLIDAATGRITATGTITRGTQRAAMLLADYDWSPRTVKSRTSQWQVWVSFCTSENRMLLPATEAHFIAFIGWLAGEREAGRRSVSAV